MSSKKKNILRIIAAVGAIGLIAVISLVACKRPVTQTGEAVVKEDHVEEDKKPNKNLTKTVAVFGVDKDGYRPDVIFVVHFDSDTNKGKVVSVPRDTKVIWTEAQKDVVRKNDGYVVSKSKLNEMTSYGGIENIRELTVKHIEDMLDITIDNYVVVNIDAFKQIVDAIGGVEVDVPQRMYYQDKAQELYIDLQPGLQMLDGDKAEQLIRFRKGYVEGDIGRIKTEQLFLEAFAKKVTSPSIIKDLPKLVPILFKSVQTDIGIGEALSYYPYVKQFDMNNLSFHTIPGEATYEPGAWYFIPDYVQIENFTRDVFLDLPPLPIDENAVNTQLAESEPVEEVHTYSSKPKKTTPQKEVTEHKQESTTPKEENMTTPSEVPVVPEGDGDTTTSSENTDVTGETVVPPTTEQQPPTGETTPSTEGEGTAPDEDVVPPVVDENQQTPTEKVPTENQTNGDSSFEVPQN